MKVDLHNHSYYSDGVDSIDGLAKKAKLAGVSVFALTDHDSVIGALNIPENLKNTILPGIELSTYLNGESVHIVGLFKGGVIPDEIIKFSKDFLAKRKERAIQMMNKIKEIYGLKVDLDDLLKSADKTAVTRGNMLRNLMKCNELTLQEAQLYISNKSKAYIPMSKMLPNDGIDFLKRNNCFTILAHPVLLKKETLEMLDLSLFDAIEARYPKNGIGDFEYFANLAKQHKILISAGSDCHGDLSHSNIGTSCLTKEEFKPIAFSIGYDEEELKWK